MSFQPVHEFWVRIAFANSNIKDEPAHPHNRDVDKDSRQNLGL